VNFFQLSILATMLFNLVLGVTVFCSNRKRLLNQVFLASSAVTVYWLLCLFFGSTAGTEHMLEFWIRQSTVAGAMIPLMMNAVRLAIVMERKSWRAVFRGMIRWIVPFAALAICIQTEFFLARAELPAAGQTVGNPVYGPGFPLLLLYLIAALAALLWNVVADYPRLTGIRKTEIQFVVLGWLGSLFLAIVFLVAPQLTGNMEIGMFLPLADVFRVGVIAYGIAQRRILDFESALRRIIAFGLMLVFLIGIYAAALEASQFLLRSTPLAHPDIAHMLAALAVALSIAPAQRSLQAFTGILFAGGKATDVGALIRHSSRILSSISTIDELVEEVRDLIGRTLATEESRLLIAEDGRFVEPGDDAARWTIDRDDPIIRLLERRRESVVREMLSRFPRDAGVSAAAARMKDLGVHAAAGVFSKGDLLGVLLLGARMSGKVYGLIEQQALEGLAGQLASSLENAKLYTEVQNSRIYNAILLDQLVGGVIAMNPAREITIFNREAQRITGLERGDVIGADLAILPAPLREGLEQALRGGGRRDVEDVLTIEDREIPVRYGTTRFQSHTDEIMGALLVLTDQTEIKKLEGQVRRTDRLASLGTLAAGMAHEIKNPLVSLKTFAQLLPERYDDADFRHTFTGLLSDEVARIDRIVNELLGFARPAKPSLAPIHLREVLDKSLNLLKQQLRQRQIRLTNRYEAASDLIQGDADMLAQALINFFLNSIESMEAQGALTVSTRTVYHRTNQLDLTGRLVTEPQLELAIEDTGRGIAAEDLAHVFDPFFTTKAAGTGLGMSVAHGIIQEHHGVIDILSEVDRGTCLTIVFPLLSGEKTS